MRLPFNASQDSFNVQKQALYCINQSQKYIQSKKKQQKSNKYSLDYILPQSNKQKIFGNLIPLTARMYPSSFNDAMRFTNTQYSSVRVRKHKNQFQKHHRYNESRQNKESLRKYSQILSQRKKQQQGGLDSFWMFKKQMIKQQPKKIKPNNPQNINDKEPQPEINKTQAAFHRILSWGKQPLDSLIPKNILKNYISSKFGQNFASWFINFYQFRAYTTYKQFQQIAQRFKNMKIRESHVVTFFIYDHNADAFLCPRDIFSVFERQLSPKIQKDVLNIAEFAKKNIGRNQGNNDEFKIEHVVIRDDWLTIKDYEMYFKKVDEPYLKATNKKDTVFSKTFAVLDHRQKIRSVRKQLNQKKNMYDQLYGEIAKQRKNHAFIEQDDYKLNYSFLNEIFKHQQSQVFKYFCDFLFNI